MAFGILLVDDAPGFREMARVILEPRDDLRLVGEAEDGLDAVQMAQQLRPDLILLDIGLPRLNGIEVARRVAAVSPASKILVLSQESSRAVVSRAFEVGALGYVVKSHAGRELLSAINKVLDGEKFVSSGVGGSRMADVISAIPSVVNC
jgi:DNA-binding NarL/FixJ family response regulator